jgi:sarcosine oxidase
VSRSHDAIVIGLGAMGSATAYHLAARGAKVLGIDQFDPPHEMGSSHGETRIIRLVYYEHPLYVPMVQRSYELWRKLEKESGESLMTITGGLMLGAESSGLIKGARRAAEEHKLHLEQIPHAKLQDRFPQIMPLPGFKALLDPAAGFLNPEGCVRAHIAQARKLGATIRTNEQVLNWIATPDGGVRVRTTHGSYEARKLVLTVGPWLPELLGAVGPRLVVERQTQIWLRPPGDPEQWSPDRFPIFLCEFDDGQLIYGFPLQKQGWKVAVHYEGEHVHDLRAMPREVTARDVNRVRSAVSRLFGWVEEAELLDAASCLYTDTPDLRFVIDFLPGTPQVLVSSPCSGHGFKFAAAIGEMQASLVLDGKCGFDISPFRIDR